MTAAPATPERDTDRVRGERTTALVEAGRSLQSRLSSILAAALMLTVGLAALTWYYAHAMARPTQSRQAMQTAALTRAQGELALPPLGPIRQPTAPAAGAEGAVQVPAPTDFPLEESRTRSSKDALSAAQAGVPAAPPKDPRELALERRLSGLVFAGAPNRTPTSGEAGAVTEPVRGLPAGMEPHTGPGVDDAIGPLLHTSVTPGAEARVMPTHRLLLPKGAFIDCTLETAIDSTLPGMTTCLTAADTFGADGKVVLLERGTKLVGETHGQVQQGRARVFVLWTQARTPAGVVVPLDSPGTDELGRAGLPGQVQRHFWERFGAAMLVSLIDGAIQAGVQASNHSGGTVVYAPSGSQEVLTEVLKDTLHIAPTVVKHNGDRIQVLVARDIDFRPVYELRASDTSR